MVKKSMILCLLLVACYGQADAARRIAMGERFPAIVLPQPQQDQQRAYLGLAPGATFSINQIEAEVVLVEILNVLCPHCQKQTLPYNELFEMIESDPQTRGKILMLGVAVGNSDLQIEDFIDIYAVDFPIVSDKNFKLHTAVGGGPTPFSIYLRRDPGKAAVVAGTHLGEDKDMADLFAYLKETLSQPVSEFAELPTDEDAADTTVEAYLPAQQMAERINKSFGQFGPVAQFAELKLPSQRRVYRALVGERPLFAEVLARSAICDVCHDVHFYYLFDAAGKVVAFESLHLTRHGNVVWTREETSKMRKRVVGGYLTTPWNFDPEVDAISRATMTSAIIFNSLDQGTTIMQELEQLNYLNMETK